MTIAITVKNIVTKNTKDVKLDSIGGIAALEREDQNAMSKGWTPADMPSQAGRKIVITGGNSGIGWHTALELAKRGAEVTLTARSHEKADDAIRRIIQAYPSASVKKGILDLSVPDSVSRFAAEYTGSLDLLVNNAGIMGLPKRELSVDGHELQFATNVLGPYRLTGLLLPALLKSDRPRVVTVSSGTHTMSNPVPLTDLESESGYNPMKVYGKTKLANILFARELQRRAGDRLLSVLAHPGAAKTGLFGPTVTSTKIVALLIYPLLQSAEMGAWPSLLAATSPDVKPGGYYGPGGLMGLRGNPTENKTSDAANDQEGWKRLFEDLERITGIEYDFSAGAAAASEVAV